jgi:hypothetical protein
VGSPYKQAQENLKLAHVQWQNFGGGCGAKFSTTPLVSGEIHLFIRWSAHTLGVHVKREGSLTRTPPPPPPPSVRPSRHDAPRVAGMSRADGYIFAAWEKRVLRTRTVFVYSGRYRIVGCCNRLELVRRGRPTYVRV